MSIFLSAEARHHGTGFQGLTLSSFKGSCDRHHSFPLIARRKMLETFKRHLRDLLRIFVKHCTENIPRIVLNDAAYLGSLMKLETTDDPSKEERTSKFLVSYSKILLKL